MQYHWELLTSEEEDLIARGIMEGGVHGGPFHLMLSPTDRCNFDCFFCTARGDGKSELSWETLRGVLESGVEMGLKSIGLTGGGEPLIHRHLGQLMDFLEEHEIRVYALVTNGTALTQPLAERFARRGIRWITVSLNETTAETHTEMNRSSPLLYTRAVEGIQNAVRALHSVDGEVRVQVFIWKHNFRRLLAMIEEALVLGPDIVLVNSLYHWPGEVRLDASEREELRALLSEAMGRWAPRLEFRLSDEGLQEFAAAELHRHHPQAFEQMDITHTDRRVEYCCIPWYAPMITANGDVFPCCNMIGEGSPVLGNVNDQTLREIWLGERYREFRETWRQMLLAEGDTRLMDPHRARCLSPLCFSRSACQLNYYLAPSRFYRRIDAWAEDGPRRAYRRRWRWSLRRWLRRG
jgi:MoaA/NifB/PqqE/SkfB family radical SAM enzyme